ncbi:MAG: glycosyltransferase [Pseudomonadales bacterium]|nr:glycosyltransferase [Pseudomonadales bacterium]
MRVLVATPWFPNQRDGWPGIFVAKSVCALAEAGCQVGVLNYRAHYPWLFKRWVPREHLGEVSAEEFPELAFLKTERYFSLPGQLLQNTKDCLLDKVVGPSIQSACEEFLPDLIHVHTETLLPPIVNAGVGTPVVVTIHGQNTNSKLMSGRHLSRLVSALRSAAQVIVVGDPLSPFVSSLLGEGGNPVTLWNGVDTMEGRVREDCKAIRLVTVSNLVPEKGVQDLVSVLASIPKSFDWRLTIVGSGPCLHEIIRLIDSHDLGDRVVLTGNLPNREVLSLMNRSDIFVLPSRREAFGIVYAEAMACGLLAVGIEGQGPSQFIENGTTGYLVRAGDNSMLQELLLKIFRMPRSEWIELAEAGRRYAEANLSWQRHAEKLLMLYKEALG